MSRSLLFSLSLLVWLVASACSAQLRKPSLHWTRGEAAAGCIDPRSLATRVEELTGPVLVGPRDSDYAIEGHIEARAGGFVVRLSVTDRHGAPRGERLVEHVGVDCRAFDQTVVFLIALTIDPDLALESAVPASGLGDQQPGDVLLQDLSAHPPVPVQLTPAPPPLPKPIVVAPVPQAIRWNAGLGLSTAAGELPKPGLGLSVGFALRLTRWFRSLRRCARARSCAASRWARCIDCVRPRLPQL